MTPLMSPREIAAFKRALLQSGKKHLSVLEWGSGGSTVYFTQFLRDHGITYTWISIEYNKDWYERVSAVVAQDPSIKLVLFDAGNTHLHQRDVNMDAYVEYPSTLGMSFDVILVDGRKRRRCVLEAHRLLAPNGVVFLHDAQRRHYHSALTTFPTRSFVTPFLWSGRREVPSRGVAFSNRIQTIWGRSIYVLLYAPVHAAKRIIRRLVYGV